MTVDDLRELLDGIPYPDLCRAFGVTPNAAGNWQRGGSLTAHARFLTGLEALGWELRRKKVLPRGVDRPENPPPK